MSSLVACLLDWYECHVHHLQLPIAIPIAIAVCTT